MNILWVGAGGFIGAVCRYAMSGWVHRWFGNSWFPVGTLAVNMLGCLVIGMLAGMSESRQLFTPEMRLFLFIGLLGGFTTFSTFGYETISLFSDGQLATGLINIFGQLILGLGGVWLGLVLGRIV
ncbi:MAG: fluoride efflux transporter CrcB [Calditrichota bacterium]